MSDWLEAFADESNKIEGMDPASLKELNALAAFIAVPLVTTSALETYVAVVAPGHVLRRTKGLNVRVGNHIAPPGGPDIEKALKELLSNMGTGTPYHTHVAYEMLHPFTDGNGRSGRAF